MAQPVVTKIERLDDLRGQAAQSVVHTLEIGFYRHLPMVAFREDRRQPDHGRPHSTGFSGDAPILSQYACYFNMLPARCLIRTNCHRKGDETWHRQPNHHAKTEPSPSISTMKQPTLSSLTTPRRSSSASSPSSSPSAFSSTINRPVTAAAL